MNDKIVEFDVKGTKGDIYNVFFGFFAHDDIQINCSCPSSGCCHHILDILRGNPENIISNNQSDLSVIRDWVEKSGKLKMLNRLEKIEIELKELNKEKSKIKRNLCD